MGTSPDKFKTPHVDNVFDDYSEFKSGSGGVKGFQEHVDSDLKLRKSDLDQVPTREKVEEEEAPPAHKTPEKKMDVGAQKKFNIKDIIETAKRTHKDSFEKLKEDEIELPTKLFSPAPAASKKDDAKVETKLEGANLTTPKKLQIISTPQKEAKTMQEVQKEVLKNKV